MLGMSFREEMPKNAMMISLLWLKGSAGRVDTMGIPGGAGDVFIWGRRRGNEEQGGDQIGQEARTEGERPGREREFV